MNKHGLAGSIDIRLFTTVKCWKSHRPEVTGALLGFEPQGMDGAQLNISDYLLAAGAPGDIALVEGGESHSYADLRTTAGRLAAELATLDLPAGSRVGLLGANSLFWVAAYLAAMKLHNVAVPLSDKATPEDIRRNIDLAGCATVFVDRRCLRRYLTAFDDVPVITDEALYDEREPHWPTTTTDPSADAVLMFTSGTTNQPKAVRVTHGNIQANTESIISYLGVQRDDRALVILPFYYCYGASLLHTHLRVGARVVLCNSFVFPETAIDLLEKQECTVFAGVPSSFQLLLRAGTFATRALPALRIIQQAGGKLSPILVRGTAGRPTTREAVRHVRTDRGHRAAFLSAAGAADREDGIDRQGDPRCRTPRPRRGYDAGGPR